MTIREERQKRIFSSSFKLENVRQIEQRKIKANRSE